MKFLKKWKKKCKKFRASYGYFPVKRNENFSRNWRWNFLKFYLVFEIYRDEDYLGAFVISLESTIFKNDKYKSILELLLCNSLAETASQYMQKKVSEEICPTFLRPAVGYPMLAEHSLKKWFLI